MRGSRFSENTRAFFFRQLDLSQMNPFVPLPPLIRRAMVVDAPALAALGRATFVQTFMEDFAIPYPPDDIAAYLQKNYTESAMCNMLSEPGAVTWVAEKNGSLLAFANAGPNTLP
jgi:hypothetical protein